MDPDTEIDELFARADKAVMESVDARVDVRQSLHELLIRAGIDPEAQERDDPARIVSRQSH